jgi:hypothetical protein
LSLQERYAGEEVDGDDIEERSDEDRAALEELVKKGRPPNVINVKMRRQSTPHRKPQFLLHEGDGVPSSDAGSNLDAAQRDAAALYGRSSNTGPSSSVKPSLYVNENMDDMMEIGNEVDDEDEGEDFSTPRPSSSLRRWRHHS